MGASKFYEYGFGRSADEVYGELVASAFREYGDDSYNGTISATDSLVMLKSFDKYTKKNEKEAEEYINRMDDSMRKWVCYCIDLGSVSYELVTLKKGIGNTYSAKYKQKFVLQGYDEDGRPVELFSADTKSEVEAVLKKKIKEGFSGYFSLIKKPVLISGNPKVASYSTQVKSFNSKPKPTANTIRIDEIHKYLFVGYAAY